MDLKIKDVADLLNVSESTIRRWLSEGKIPAYRINHQYRFSRNEIEDWVMGQKLKTQAVQPFASNPQADLAATPLPSGGSKQFSLYRALHYGGVYNNLPGSSKEAVFKKACSQIAEKLSLDPEVLSELLLDREKLQPTSLGHGIGIPHARDFLLKNHQDFVALVFPENPIEDYGGIDQKPVHSLFFLFATDDKRHLHLLAKIAHLSSLPATKELLRSQPTKERFLDYVKNWESSIAQPLEN